MKRRHRLSFLVAVLSLFGWAVLAGAAPASARPVLTPNAAQAPALHVSGNKLVDSGGSAYRLLGVNRSGGEFACIQGNGIWDGPMDQKSIDAMLTWNVHTVRVPLNEECWLGTADVPAQYGGTTYQQAVKDYVNLLLSNGITPIVEMHWNYGQYTGPSAGCPDVKATCQKPMPDAQYAPQFWTGVASTFKDNRVVFDLFNEPYPERATGSESSGWACWRDGGTCQGIGYQVAGFQSLVNAVRATGNTNVILLGGLAYSNDLTQWLQYKPSDPTGNLAAFAHLYNFNSCSNTSCFDSQLAPVAQQVPLTLSEIGENDCAHGFVDTVMNWADAHNVGYLAWTWNTWNCSTGPALITDYDGTPTAYGAGVQAHLKSVGSGDTTAPTAPTGLRVTSTTSGSVSLAWTASTDNVGVTGYVVYRDGTEAGTSATTSFTDTGLEAGTQHSYTVKARDAAGNTSAASAAVTATTGTGGGGSCTVAYHVDNDWGSGFTATVTVTNTGTTATKAWRVTWTWAGNQKITNAWSTTATQSGQNVTATDAGYNGALAAGAGTSFGFQATYSGGNTAPKPVCTLS
jgi:chitodextrinase